MVGVELVGCGRRKIPRELCGAYAASEWAQYGPRIYVIDISYYLIFVSIMVFEDGPIFLARVKCDEVTSPVVPRAITNRDDCGCGIPGWGEVMRVGPSGGVFPETEDMV